MSFFCLRKLLFCSKWCIFFKKSFPFYPGECYIKSGSFTCFWGRYIALINRNHSFLLDILFVHFFIISSPFSIFQYVMDIKHFSLMWEITTMYNKLHYKYYTWRSWKNKWQINNISEISRNFLIKSWFLIPISHENFLIFAKVMLLQSHHCLFLISMDLCQFVFCITLPPVHWDKAKIVFLMKFTNKILFCFAFFL